MPLATCHLPLAGEFGEFENSRPGPGRDGRVIGRVICELFELLGELNEFNNELGRRGNCRRNWGNGETGETGNWENWEN